VVRSQGINNLLKRSAELEQALYELLVLEPYDSSDRIMSSRILCDVAFEHAESTKLLIATGNYTSAIGVVRLQYEALVRAMWALYAASDIALSKLMSELTPDGAKRAEKLPMLSVMLKKLEGKAPAEAVAMLLEFKEVSWKVLSSYVHGGTHAMHRHGRGYPQELLQQVLKSSNGISTMVGMLLVILSGDKTQLGKMTEIQIQFADCLPELKKVGL
jgi:hypothetical protein